MQPPSYATPALTCACCGRPILGAPTIRWGEEYCRACAQGRHEHSGGARRERRPLAGERAA